MCVGFEPSSAIQRGATTKYGTRVPSADVAQCCDTPKRDPSKVGACCATTVGSSVAASTKSSVGGVVNDSYVAK